jgi:hypothetical protein
MVKSISLKSDVSCRNGKSIHLVVLYLAHISERLLLLYVSDFVSCQDKAVIVIIIICQLARIFWIKFCVTTWHLLSFSRILSLLSISVICAVIRERNSFFAYDCPDVVTCRNARLSQLNSIPFFTVLLIFAVCAVSEKNASVSVATLKSVSIPYFSFQVRLN